MKRFTLIELLVVIAIFGVLCTILLPSIYKAKEKSKIVEPFAERFLKNDSQYIFGSLSSSSLDNQLSTSFNYLFFA